MYIYIYVFSSIHGFTSIVRYIYIYIYICHLGIYIHIKFYFLGGSFIFIVIYT